LREGAGYFFRLQQKTQRLAGRGHARLLKKRGGLSKKGWPFKKGASRQQLKKTEEPRKIEKSTTSMAMSKQQAQSGQDALLKDPSFQVIACKYFSIGFPLS
jgi:hypothetical protein